MKSLLVFARIFIVGCLWCIVFTEGIRVIMLCNWHFDIFWPDHWRQLWTLWKAGWSPHVAKEWAFFIILITFFPMLITGWWTLCLVAWEEIIYKIIMLPVTLYRHFIKKPINVLTTNNPYGIVKRKSYKQIRPVGVGSRIQTPISDYGTTAKPLTPTYNAFSAQTATSALSTTGNKVNSKNKKTDIPSTIDHALFKFDDDDDDFDLDFDSFEKTDINKVDTTASKKSKDSDFDSAKYTEDSGDDDFSQSRSSRTERRNRRNRDDNEGENRKYSAKDVDTNDKRNRDNKDNSKEEGTRFGPVYDILQQKGFYVLKNINVEGTIIDFIGVTKDEICLCLVDKEAGDWLADEEMFNGEDPLWFSENSHRISPVCLLKKAADSVKNKLEDENFEQKVSSFVIIQMANIINADDMFETWREMDIDVTRINRGAPKEIRLFSKVLHEASERMSKKELERLQKVLENK